MNTKICIAGLNRRAGYATGHFNYYTRVCFVNNHHVINIEYFDTQIQHFFSKIQFFELLILESRTTHFPSRTTHFEWDAPLLG